MRMSGKPASCHLRPCVHASRKHQGVDALDETEFLSKRDKDKWTHRSARGVTPASESFGTNDQPGFELNHRLVLDADAAGVNRGAEILTQLQPVEKFAAHRRDEYLVPRLPAALGEVHRQVGIGDQRLRAGPAGRRSDTDADARSDVLAR